ncbi:MAG: SdpI family protein [Cytophagaceae bacterium]|nr:SdpI family protein [Cytophagaceae bacterium]
MNTETEKPLYRRWVTLIACLVADLPLLYLALVWEKLPTQVPMHYNISGEIDRYGTRYEMLGLIGFLSAVGVGLMLLFYFLPRFDPKGNLKYSSNALQMIGLGTCLLVATLGICLVRMAISGDVNEVLNVLPFALAGLMAFIGNYMTSLKPNYFAGFRTPWTLENEVVWRKTHRVGGRILFWGSLLSVVPMLLLPDGATKLVFFVAVLMGLLVYTVYYSYRVFQQEKSRTSQTA